MSRKETVYINSEKIRKRLRKLGKKQKDLAVELDMQNTQSINNALSKGRLSKELTYKMCKILDLAPEDITGQLDIFSGHEEFLPRLDWEFHLKYEKIKSPAEIVTDVLLLAGFDSDAFTPADLLQIWEMILDNTARFCTSKLQKKA